MSNMNLAFINTVPWALFGIQKECPLNIRSCDEKKPFHVNTRPRANVTDLQMSYNTAQVSSDHHTSETVQPTNNG